MKRNDIGVARKFLALALSLVVAMTFIPLLGDGAYADEPDATGGSDATVEDSVEPAVTPDPNQVDVVPEQPVVGDDNLDIVDENVADEGETAPAEAAADVSEPEGPSLGGGNATHLYIPALMDTGTKKAVQAKKLINKGVVDPSKYTVNIKQSGKTVSISGAIDSNYRFVNVFVDTTPLYQPFALISLETTIDMSNFDTGYHTVSLAIAQKSDTSTLIDFVGKQYMRSNNITEKPNYSGKFRYVYSKHFQFYPFSLTGNLGSYNLYMEYSKNGGKTWKRTGYMKANAIKLYTDQGYKISGLSPNKTYKTRLRYGQYVKYSTDYAGDGKSYFFGGPVRNTATIKTGVSKKPRIKSIKVKGIKVKRHKHKVAGHYEWVGNSLIWIGPYTEKYYTYKLKVTVKLKKKPGATGLWINGKFVKGNKKKYTVTLPGSSYSAKKPKGKKYTVKIRSYKGKSYGGYSPMYTKKKKIK